MLPGLAEKSRVEMPEGLVSLCLESSILNYFSCPATAASNSQRERPFMRFKRDKLYGAEGLIEFATRGDQALNS